MQKLKRTTLENANSKESKVYLEANPDVEIWGNDIYSVFVRRNQPVQGQPEVTMCWISFHRRDRRAILDWRHMQWMKNQLVGEENEGVELFPAESRLVDGANEFHMWVFEDPAIKFPFGFFEDRLVSDTKVFGETQRKWPEARKPKDLNARVDEALQLKKKLDGSS